MSTPKINQQNRNKETLNNKDNNFFRARKLLRGWKLFVLCFGAFCAREIFRKKQINRLQIVK